MVTAMVARLIEAADAMGPHAERAGRAEVIKAVLLAGATKPWNWQPQPGKPLDEHLGGTGGGQGTEGAQHDQPAVGERDTLRREPQDDRLEAGHQADGDTETDQGSGEHEGKDAVGECEQEGPGGGEEEQGAVDEARPQRSRSTPQGS